MAKKKEDKPAKKVAGKKTPPHPAHLPHGLPPSDDLPVNRIVRPSGAFDILAQQPEWLDTATAIMQHVADKTKNTPTGFKTMSDIRRAMLPLRSFYLQYKLGTYGIPHKSLNEITGAEHIGKSSLITYFMGDAMFAGSPCYMQLTESKNLQPERVLRFLSSNPVQAVHMMDMIRVEEVHTLEQSCDKLIDWVFTMRGRNNTQARRINVPMDIALFAAIDVWGKLMNPKEAAGRSNYGSAAKGEKKDIGEGSNFGHAKWAQEFCRYLPQFLDENNVILWQSNHQNAKIDMGGNASFMSADQGALYNNVKIGGNAANQTSSIQLILARKQQAKDRSNNLIGDIVRFRVQKQSYGPKGRVGEFLLQNERFMDRDDYLQPALVFDEAMANWFAEEHLLGTTIDNRMYSSRELSLQGATAAEFCAAFEARDDLKLNLGRKLGIAGYIDIVDEIRRRNRIVVPDNTGIAFDKMEEAVKQPEIAAVDEDAGSKEEP